MDVRIEEFLRRHFSDETDVGPYGAERLDEFLRLGPLHTFIPRALGGGLDRSCSYLDVVELASYHSVPLGLTLGITGSLFLMPVCRHAQPALRDRLVQAFLNSTCTGGIMITEPTGGTDMLRMLTCHQPAATGFSLSGVKCWAGLTGQASHWLVATRKVVRGQRSKMLALAYVAQEAPGVRVTETFDALGLNPIPYGRTEFSEVAVAEEEFLTPPQESGLRVIYDTVFRSRLGMPAIAAGLCRRLSDLLVVHCDKRETFGNKLSAYDQVQYRLETIRGLWAVNEALRQFAGTWMDAHDDVSPFYVLVNAAKVVCSESMALVSDSAVQLYAAASYKRSHLAGRAYVDARPFRIFEGTNDVLNENTLDTLTKAWGPLSMDALGRELGRYGLSVPGGIPALAAHLLEAPPPLSQRVKVLLGAMVARIFAMAILERSAVAGADRVLGVAALRDQLGGMAGELGCR